MTYPHCGSPNPISANFCQACGHAFRRPLPPEPEEGVWDAEYRVIPEKRLTDAIWTKDTFLGGKKWLRGYRWPMRIAITVVELLGLVGVYVLINTYLIK